jgi:general secretion pathway protein M
MIGGALIERLRLWRSSLSALSYAAIIGSLVLTIVLLLIHSLERYHTYQDSIETLARLEGRAQHASETEASAPPWPSGSPVLEGQTATVASAMLLQQVTGAITRAGGTMVTTEVEAQAPQSKTNYLKIVATCELEQVALQRVLYDLEAGMPFLFVDQLLVQSSTSPNERGRLRVRMAISGLWPGAK